MTTPAPLVTDDAFLNRAVEAIIRIGLLAVLVVYCFQIIQPFIIPVLWGVIITVAVYPNYQWLQRSLGERRTLAATLFTLLALVLLIIPTLMLSDTLIAGATGVGRAMDAGKLAIPPPPESVAAWPIIGEPLSRFWSLASENLGAALSQIAPHLKAVAKWLLAAAGGAGLGILQFVLAIIIAGVLLSHGEAGVATGQAIALRLAGKRGAAFIDISRATIRSVARGILGVALIQSILAGLGFLAVGLPGAGLWAFLCLLLAVVQVGIFPIVIPILIYVFSTADTVTAVVFLIWSLLVGSIDNVLKPILLGRGVNVPMAVIFLGAIGGFLASGIIGLFVGSVILVLGYQLFRVWLTDGEPPGGEPGLPGAAAEGQGTGQGVRPE